MIPALDRLSLKLVIGIAAALMLALLVAAMVGLAFASVPLYRLFCELTGFDGTPLRAESAPGAVAGEVGVRFDANIDPALPPGIGMTAASTTGEESTRAAAATNRFTGENFCLSRH